MSEIGSEVEVINAGGKEVSLQVYQDVYNSITGKTEVLNRLFFEAHTATLSDLERLHRDFEVQLEQYDCKVTNCHVSVRYCNGKTEGFSGFNRFKLDGTNKTAATENIEIEYDFMVILPKTREAKPYKLVIGVRSTLGVVKRLEETQATETEKSLFFTFDRGTARLELHYIDLAVARTLEALVEDWYKSLRKTGGPAKRKIIQFASSTLPLLSRVTLIGCSATLSYMLLKDTVSSNSDLFVSGLSSGTGLLIASLIGIPLSSYLKKQVERSMSHSTLMIGEADSQLLENSKKGSFRRVILTVLGWIGAIAIGLVTTYLSAQLGLS